MLSSLIVLAQTTVHEVGAAAAAAHGEAGGVTKIFSDFGINVPGILAQVVNFSIVAFILWYFAFKPVLASIEERQQKISAGLKYAEDMKAQLAAAQQESATLIKNAQLEANKIIEESRRTSKELADKIQKEATDRANDTITKTQQAIELERRKMLADVRGEIARLVVTTTEHVLAKKLSESDRAAYNEAAARELTSA
ncbi:MAG TPA: F0F1 ATP synthase subunit B [Opitutaceae bacterium]|nr:F0F1 ATP synthase subunit B [Opitutaceae bacterium]